MAMFRYGHASVVATSITPDDWTNKVYKGACSDGKCRMKTAKTIIAKYSPDKFLLSHVTIIASVDTELANPQDTKSDYYIKPEFSKFVNNNGDAWTKEVILNSYKSFIGGDNFLEHVQQKELSKGKIVDAVPREIIIGKDKDGKDLSTIYVDILVATDRKHEDLIRRIESRELSTLSMGCLIKFSRCSRCGNRAVDETQACDHVRFQKNNTFFDNNGIQRKVAELCIPWNNKILMGDGSYKYVDLIEKGNSVITHKGTASTVNKVFCRDYTGEMVRIKAEGLPKIIESTPEHPHYVYDGSHFSFKRAMDITLSDFIVCRAPIKVDPVSVLNKDRAKLIGLYIAEGSLSGDSIVEFNLNDNDEQDIAREISELLEQEFPVQPIHLKKKDWVQILKGKEIRAVRRSDYGSTLVEDDYICRCCGAPSKYIVFLKSGRSKCRVCGTQATRHPEDPFCNVRIYRQERTYNDNYIGERLIKKEGSKRLTVRYRNKECADFFRRFCSGTRAFTKTPSPELISAPLEIQKEILINWLRGDGSIDSELRLRGYTTSENVYKTMKLFALRLNLWSRGQVVFNNQLIELGKLRDIARDSSNIYDDEKCHPRFVLYFSPRDCSELTIAAGFCKTYPKKLKENRKLFGFVLHKVKQISSDFFSGKVYNLEVKNDNSFIMDDGVITHNCGHHTEPDSVQFIEASWVAQPAFTGAVLRDFVMPSEEIMAKLESAEKKPAYKKKPGDYLKAAAFADIIAQDPKEKTDVPEEAAGAEDAPEEPPADEPAADEAEPAGEAPAEAPPMPEPEPESDLKVWKKDLKKQVMKQITDEVMKDMSEEEAQGPSDIGTYDETLIRPASLVLNKVWGAQKSWDRYIQQKTSNSLDKKSYDKLRYGVHIAMTNSDLTALKDYGYNKRDFLAVLSFLDDCLKKPLPVSIKKTIASLGGTRGKGPVELCRVIVTELGRKLTREEARRTLSWLKLLDHYC